MHLTAEHRFQLLQTAVAASIVGLMIGTVVIAGFEHVDIDAHNRSAIATKVRNDNMRVSSENNVLIKNLCASMQLDTFCRSVGK